MSFLFDEPWLLFLAVGILLFTSSAVGYGLALATRVNEISHHHEQITGLRDGLFVLLGLLLGFSIAMVLPRFDLREQLVVDEANAIRTTMLRAELLPEPERSKTLELLREYVLVRQDFGSVGSLNSSALSRTTQRTKSLQEELWQQIVAVTKEDQSAIISAYVQSLNDTISVAERRLAGFEHRVPKTVWVIIVIVGVVQSFVTGYHLKQKFWFALVITPLVVAVVMGLIADLDSPHTGFIHVEQNSMERVVNDLTGAKP
jgi:hypothetical protein